MAISLSLSQYFAQLNLPKDAILQSDHARSPRNPVSSQRKRPHPSRWCSGTSTTSVVSDISDVPVLPERQESRDDEERWDAPKLDILPLKPTRQVSYDADCTTDMTKTLEQLRLHPLLDHS